MKVKNVICTCGACPSQWEALTEDNRPVYVRYRWGTLSIGVGNPGESIDRAIHNEILGVDIGDEWSGVLSWENVLEYLDSMPEIEGKTVSE